MAEQEHNYHCILRGDDLWHLTQSQAGPPPAFGDGVWTSCGEWSTLKRGYEKRRPTCPNCIREVDMFELTNG